MKCQSILLTLSISYILLLAVNFFYVYIYLSMLTVILWLLLVCNWLGLLSSKQESEQFHTQGTLGRIQWKTYRHRHVVGLNIVRATSLEALQMSYTEFLAVSIAVIHWGAAAKEPL